LKEKLRKMYEYETRNQKYPESVFDGRSLFIIAVFVLGVLSAAIVFWFWLLFYSESFSTKTLTC
jgi:flagellar basal body-associated protein FliL